MSDHLLSAPTVLTFDSGFGGLSVLRHILKALPDCSHVYAADDLGFPYGPWEEQALVDHCATVIAGLIERFKPDVVVIACNTASTALLPVLRARHAIAFVGTVPAIKPAAHLSKSGMISVLATPGTVQRDYTQALIDTFASHLNITLVGSPKLATLADEFLSGKGVDEDQVFRELLPCFQEHDEDRTDVIVLACTHYPLLLPVYEKLAPWPVTYLDPGAAIAKRVRSLVPVGSSEPLGPQFVYCSGAEFPSEVAAQFSA